MSKILNRSINNEPSRAGLLGVQQPTSVYQQQPMYNQQQQPRQQFQSGASYLPQRTLGLPQPQQQQAQPATQTPFQLSKESMFQGLQGVKKLAEGESKYMDLLEQKYLGRTAAAGAAKGAAMQQKYLGQDLDPSIQRALEGEQQRQQESSMGQIRGDIGAQRIASQESAQKDLAGLGMQINQYEMTQKSQQFNELLNAGGVDNIEQAQKIYEEMYGSTLDPYLAQENSKLKVLGKYAAMPGITSEEAIRLAKEEGALDFLGIDENEAKNYLDPIIMGSNPLYQAESEYGSMLKQGLISKDDYDNMITFAKWSITNPDGMEIKDSFIVKDNKGNEIGNFLTEEEANKFIEKNNDKNYEISKGKYIGRKGEYEEYTGMEEGEYFTKGENVYKIMEGKQILVEPDYDDPFSVQNQKFLELGEDNKYYKKVLDKQIKASISDSLEIPEDITEDSALYKGLMNSNKVGKYNENNLTYNESGLGTGSIVKIAEFDSLAPNSLVVIDGKLYRYNGDTRLVIKRDDDLYQYNFTDILTGDIKSIKAKDND